MLDDAALATLQIERTTVGGVPMWWGSAPGPANASLMFRTGRADETLATAGITHLIEHLALFALGRRNHPYNGFVDDDRCVLYASGTADEVVAFVRDAAAAVASLPLDRVPVERRVLRTEAARREAPNVIARLLAHRFGAGGYGLAAYNELGLRWVGAEELGAWAAERFTRENAVLWLTVEPPADLDLALPSGRRVPPPDPLPLDIGYPAVVAEGTGGVAVGGVAERSIALGVAASVVAERLVDRLRLERGLAYSPFASVDVLGTEQAHVTIAADCLDEHAVTVRDELWRVANDVAEHGATDEELARAHAAAVRSLEHPDAVRTELDQAAYTELVGRPRVVGPEMLDKIAALDGPSTAAALAAALAEPILVAPAVAGGPPGFRPRNGPVSAPVSGTRYRAPRAGLLRARPRQELTIGPDGVTSRGDGEPVTILWKDCVAVERYIDGSMMVIARDEAWILLRPGDYERGDVAVEDVLAHLPPGRIVPELEVELFDALMQAGAFQLGEDVMGELRALLSELGDGELPTVLVAAQHWPSVGLLAITDARLVWLRCRGEELERIVWAWGSLAEVHARSMGELRITLREGGTDSFTIKPVSRTRELAARIAERIVDA